MKISNRIPPLVIAAATGMLQVFIPELSPQNLIAALKEYGETGTSSPQDTDSEKPLTRHEAAELLSVCLATINNYMNQGILRKIQISERSVRIDAQSVKDLLNGK